MLDPGELVCAADAARILGVNRRWVLSVAAADPQFPPSQPSTTGGRCWPRSAVEAWAVAHPDRGLLDRGPELPPVGRWSPQVAKVLALAANEARSRNHDLVRPSHLLRALVHMHCPGASRAVLHSFGITAERLQQADQQSFVDPFASDSGLPQVDMVTQSLLERASLEAVLLVDTEVSSEHVLLALASYWAADAIATSSLRQRGLDPAAVRSRVLDLTEGVAVQPQPEVLPPELDPETAMRQWAPGIDLAPTPDGKDPRQRMPWDSAVFVDAEGEAVKRADGRALRQYFVDRDGNVVLTTDGRPVHYVYDEQGKRILDSHGRPVMTPVEIPEGSRVPGKPHRS